MITVLDFYSPTCKPCQQILKILPRLEKEVEGIAQIEKVNIDDNPALADHYDVDKVPTFVLLQDGIEVSRAVGVVPMIELERAIKALANDV